MQLTPEELTARKRRNIALAWVLVAFMVLVFTTTFLRMQNNQRQAAEAQQAAIAAQSAPVQAVTRP